MINLNSNIAKQRTRIYIERQMQAIERGFVIDILSILKNQFAFAAMLIGWGIRDTDHAVNEGEKKFRKLLYLKYKMIYDIFGNIIFEALEKAGFKKSYMKYEIKSIKDIFLIEMENWAQIEAAKKIVGINRTTKKIIAEILRKGYGDELSNQELADRITETNKKINPARALKIARTETHTAAMKSTSSAMQSTRLKYKKQWFTAGDSRVRSGKYNHVAANNEIVDKDMPYINTGEDLYYPGDSMGSAGNIIHCRCIETYNTIENGGLR